MLNIAICDDEIEQSKLMKEIAEGFLKECTISHRIHMYHAGEELLDSFECYDIVFLDISMGELNGIETGIKLYQKNRKTKIIYITNFEEFCNEAINSVHAFAYLSKPIVSEKLKEQLKELVKLVGIEKGKGIEIELFQVMEMNSMDKTKYTVLKVPVSEILYFEYLKAKRKIKVKAKNDKEYEYNGTIVEAEKKMKLYGFGFCYRGILVNYSNIVKIRDEAVFLNNGERLPLARKRKQEFKEGLNEYIHREI